MSPWNIWVDTGGTFTDCLATDPLGNLTRLKVLSNGTLRGRVITQLSNDTLAVEFNFPVRQDIYRNFTLQLSTGKGSALVHSIDTDKGFIKLQKPSKITWTGKTVELTTNEEVPVFAARLLTLTMMGKPFPQIEMKLGSTRGTNAILERKGARTALLVTKGFKDLLVIGNQQRPNLFALQIIKELPLYTEVFEINERIAADGSIIIRIDDNDIASIADQLKRKKIESVAIAFLNSYKNPVHEKSVSEKLKQFSFPFVCTSHELSSQIRILQRAETAVANAYLAPIIHNYVDRILRGLPGASLKIMTSAGGLANADEFYPKDSLLSGPAGGVVGAVVTSGLSGVDRLITFDMGGTSTDVSLYDGRLDYRYESKVGSLKILSPSLAIETIAAGGGSICDFDGYRFTVCPASAGASPGPACYGAGGPLTVTDVNVLLGRIDIASFTIPLSVHSSEVALDLLIKKIYRTARKKYSRNQVLLALAQIANEKMAGAIQKVSTQSGHNPSDYTLLSFGGAGGQHACALASMLHMSSVLIPYDAGLLSAYGIGHAKTEKFGERLILKTFEPGMSDISYAVKDLFEVSRKEFTNEHVNAASVVLEKQLLCLRFKGQENSIEIDLSETGFDFNAIRSLFRKHYERIFSHWLDHVIEVESVRVVVAVRGEEKLSNHVKPTAYKPKAIRITKLQSGEGPVDCRIYTWEGLTPGATIKGPAVVTSKNSTTVIDPGWNFYLDENNNAILRKGTGKGKVTKHGAEAELELFTNRFTAVAYEMGAMLQRTSFSINVKERLDFSCAVLDRKGYLVVNAPHIPVHLGSLGVCVRQVARHIDIKEGDVVITNHPAYGGSHLPDVTLIKGVFVKGKLIAYVANRAHHAEIGGKKPGSMPADATMLAEEGVIIAPTYLVRRNAARWNEIETLFTGSQWPTRLWDENRADLNGALASVNYGERAIIKLSQRFGSDQINRYMLKIRQHATALFNEVLKKRMFKKTSAIQYLDDGSPLCVSMTKKAGKLIIDFTGSSKVHHGNLNATSAIVQSVILYVIRLLVDRDIPMNEGLMDNVRVVLPKGLLNPDFNVASPPAVVGGNTEVSQRLTDTLLKALGMAACSQGTMNNFLFGNSRFGYYETICGGTGAGNGFAGASAVHQHMTNTRISDAELLEWRFPIRLLRFEVRKNSGGRGKWNGGEGVLREFLFTEDLDINILSQHRKEAPYGMNGGGNGKTGVQFILSTSNEKRSLKGMDSASVKSGERLVIETPGGGAWGRE